ncbi:transposase [Luteibacter flocculans]|uniref:Transposase n=1 Tax=Luteibacter flocculans TaxID=2780091 RepID=A0ABY4T9L4_9GAMM|nr:transposase [Luteibacter flocculans]
MAIYLLNPRDVRHYAESLRRRAKTDRVDAQVIARYLERASRTIYDAIPRRKSMRPAWNGCCGDGPCW